MNPFSELEAAVRGGLAAMTAAGTLPAGLDLGRVVVEPPRDPAFGDATTNAAMILAKPAGLRPMEVDGVVATLRELNRETGLTILLIEHVMRAVMALAARILVLHHGAAIAEGTPDAVVRNPAVIDSYLGAEAVG